MYSILLPPPLDPSIKMEVSSPGESARARQITHYQEPYYPCQTSSNWKYLGYQNIYFRSEQIHLWKMGHITHYTTLAKHPQIRNTSKWGSKDAKYLLNFLIIAKGKHCKVIISIWSMWFVFWTEYCG